jgi:hypothetical protein
MAPAPVVPPPNPSSTSAAPPPPPSAGQPESAQATRVPPPAPKVDLFSADALSRQVTKGLPIASPTGPVRAGRLPGESAGEDATSDEKRIAERVGGVSIDSQARTRVASGLVDPVYTRLGRALLKAWDPDRALPETSAALWAKQRARSAVIGTQLLLETAKAYGATGSPVAAGESLDFEVRPDRHDATTVSTVVDEQRTRETYRQYMSGKFNAGRTAEFLVDEHPDGRVEVAIIRGSGDADVDAGAGEDIRLAMARWHADEGPPPKRRRTLWSLRLKIVVNPPVPIGGFTFDELLEAPKMELPLGRKLLKRLKLEAVYDSDARFDASGTTALPN